MQQNRLAKGEGGKDLCPNCVGLLHRGRGSIPITALRSMPTLDVTKLTKAHLRAGRNCAKFLPARRMEAWKPSGQGS